MKPRSACQLHVRLFNSTKMASPDTKLLWGRAGAKCAICRSRLGQITDAGKPALLGEAAHIVAERTDGPRGTSILDINERNSYFNLMLLCPTCHTLIDKDPLAYPPERLHMLKAQHELRVEGQQVTEFNDAQSSDYTSSSDNTLIVNFAREWASVIPFYTELHMIIDSKERKGLMDDDDFLIRAKEWHRRRDQLKELLFLAGEPNTAIHHIPDWERLKKECAYIQEGKYLTPFSFMLDFVNPVYMVVNYGKELWKASFISQEFMDYLSFKYPPVKEFWKLNGK
jgi:HNH endonuclease